MLEDSAIQQTLVPGSERSYSDSLLLHNDMSNRWLSFDFIHGIIVDGSLLAYRITREAYANIYGPIVGDHIRLDDTDLFAEIKKDFAVYGDECVFSGEKVIRDGMGQASRYSASNCPDTVITNALIIDYTGIFKGGCISTIGKSRNPDAMNGVFSNMNGVFSRKS
ncbi:urease isoform X1 [Tanacetum coccineum]